MFYSPEPHTTKMKSASKPGPTGYFSSCGFWKNIKIAMKRLT